MVHLAILNNLQLIMCQCVYLTSTIYWHTAVMLINRTKVAIGSDTAMELSDNIDYRIG